MNDKQLDNLIKTSGQAAGLSKPVHVDGAVIRQRARLRHEIRRAVVTGLLLVLAVSLWFWSSGGPSDQDPADKDARMAKLEEDIARLQAENKVLLESMNHLKLQHQQTAIELVREQLHERGITNRTRLPEDT